MDRVDILAGTGQTSTALEGLAILKHARAVTVDCEWTARPKSVKGKGPSWPWSPNTELYSIAVSGIVNKKIYNLGMAWPQKQIIHDLLRELLQGLPVVFHNAIADMMWLDSLGIKANLYADTLLLAHLLNDSGDHDLESLCINLLGVEPWKVPLWYERPTGVQEQELLQYNVNDTHNTLLLHGALMGEYRKLAPKDTQARLRIHNKLLMRVIPLYVEMCVNGVGMDMEQLRASLDQQQTLRDQCITQLARAAGVPFEQARKIPASPMQTKQLLHSSGIMVGSTGKKVIEPLAHSYPVVQSILDVRSKNKLIGTYITPWLEMLDAQGTNRLHSIYNAAGARTGRASAGSERGGSIHQMPRNNTDFPVRNMVLPSPGNVIISGDASMIEMRVAAWLANEHTMIRYLTQERDLHSEVSAFVLGIPVAKVTKAQRQIGKSLNFGLLFGMQAPGFVTYAWINYGVRFTIEEAQQARIKYFRIYRDLSRWHTKCAEIASTSQTITTPFGQVRHNIIDMTQAANTPVQSSAQTINSLSLIYFDELVCNAGIREYVDFILTVHDSFGVEAPPFYAEPIARMMNEALKNPPVERLGVRRESIPVPFRGDVGIGKTWGSLVDFKG